ncbi:hypothetical protein ACFL0M_01580 [Thermodesulfobacteriota bacterium]
MSSILRALKKLENDPTKKRSFEPWHREGDLKKTFARRGRGFRLRYKVFYVLLAAPFLMFGGWLLLKYRIVLTKEFSPDKPITQSVEAMVKSVPVEIKKLPFKAKLKPVLKRPKTPSVSTRKTRTTTRKPLIAGGTELPISISDEKPNLQPAEILRNMRAKEPSLIESPGETGFEVQAIAWSKTPEKRIAVINGRIVHEGEYIDGVSVTQIGLDEVSLKKGSKMWKLKCGGQR